VALLAAAGLASLFIVACGGGSGNGSKTLAIAIQPTQASTEMLEKAKPLEQYLEARLEGVDVQIYVPLSQSGVVEALRFGQAGIAFMGAWPAQLAIDRAGAELALAEIREVTIGTEKQEQPYYFSYWVVPRSSSVSSLSELRGRTACFPSAVSGSGYVGPMGRMVELGLIARPGSGKEVDPRSFFGEVLFGGGYQQCWEALKSGQVDVTVIAGDVSTNLYNEVLGATRVLEQQGPLPSHAVVVSNKLDPELRDRAIEAILGLGDPQYRDLMRGFISGIFVRFERSDAETHLAAFKSYLDLTGLAFSETVR
jgi:phosphonate transport system substrate-binding protein